MWSDHYLSLLPCAIWPIFYDKLKFFKTYFQKFNSLVTRGRMFGRRVHHDRAWGRGQIVGPAEGQVDDELRKAEPGIAILQRRKHIGQSPQQEVHLQVRLRPERHCRIQRQRTRQTRSWPCWQSHKRLRFHSNLQTSMKKKLIKGFQKNPRTHWK